VAKAAGLRGVSDYPIWYRRPDGSGQRPLYPEPEDERAVVWHRLDEATGRYREVSPSAAGRYRSAAIPGLEIEVLPRADWTEGRKVRVWFQGEEVRDREAEAQAREVAEQQAHRAEQQAHRAEQQAAQERQARAAEQQARLAAEQEIARLLARLQQAGLDEG
jgi:hypothetical protein